MMMTDPHSPMKSFTVQHIKAPNSRNGNPQRLYLIHDLLSHQSVAVDEGFGGEQSMRAYLKARGVNSMDGMDRVVMLPIIQVSQAEYKRLRRAYETQG